MRKDDWNLLRLKARQERLRRNLTFEAFAADVGCSLATVRRAVYGLVRPNERTQFLIQEWINKQAKET